MLSDTSWNFPGETRAGIRSLSRKAGDVSSFPSSLLCSSVDVQRKPLEQKGQLGGREKAGTGSQHLESRGLLGGWKGFPFLC